MLFFGELCTELHIFYMVLLTAKYKLYPKDMLFSADV